MKREKDFKLEIVDNYINKDGKIYDWQGNWVASVFKRIMTKKQAERFWGKKLPNKNIKTENNN